MWKFAVRVAFVFIVWLLAVYTLATSEGCTSQYQVRDIETAGMLASRYERTTLTDHEVVIGCKGEACKAATAAPPANGSGQAYVQATTLSPHVALIAPGLAAKQAAVKPGWYTFAGWMFNERGQPEYSMNTRVIRTPFGNQVVAPPRPLCWDYSPAINQ